MHSRSGWLAVMPVFVGGFLFVSCFFFKSPTFSYQKVKVTTSADLFSYSLPSPQPASMALHTLLVKEELKSAGAEDVKDWKENCLLKSLLDRLWSESMSGTCVSPFSPPAGGQRLSLLEPACSFSLLRFK